MNPMMAGMGMPAPAFNMGMMGGESWSTRLQVTAD